MIKQLTEADELKFQKLSAEDREKRGILGRLYGRCADVIRPTRNQRLYSEKLWTKVFDSPLVKEQFEAGGIFGELTHPSYEEVAIEKIAIVMPEPPKKDREGYLVGFWDILDTPSGRILKTLCDYGYKVGISTRGTGDLITDYEGNESVDPDTYTLNALDIVLVPSVKAARLDYITESLNKTRYNKTLKQKLTESINKEDENNQRIMRESLHDIGIDLDESLFDEDLTESTEFNINPLYESLETSDELTNSINGVMGAYQNANKWLDSVKEFIYTDLSCPFFSSFVHELAHTMPGRFDKFGDILHTMDIEIPYPTTLELDNELTSIDDAFAVIFGCLDDIKANLNSFIKLTDEEFHGMACSAEELLNDIEQEYPMLFRMRDKWNQCNGDLVDFDKFVAQYVEHKEDLLESLNEQLEIVEDLDDELKNILNIVEEHFGTLSNPYFGPTYILPDGKFLDLRKYSHHSDVEKFLIDNNLSSYNYVATGGSQTMFDIGAIRCDMPKYDIILTDKQPTRSQYNTLLIWLDGLSYSTRMVSVMTPDNQFITYRFGDLISDDICDRIRRYYSSGTLLEKANMRRQKNFKYERNTLGEGLEPENSESINESVDKDIAEESLQEEKSENITYKNTEIIENEDGTFNVTIDDDTQIFNSLKNAKTYIDMMQPHLKEELYVSAGKMNDKLLNDAVREFESNAGDYGDALTFVKNKFSQYSLNDQKDIARYINKNLSESLKTDRVAHLRARLAYVDNELANAPIDMDTTRYDVEKAKILDELDSLDAPYYEEPLTEAQVGRDDSKSIEDVGAEDNTPEPIPEPEKKPEEKEEKKETTIIIKEALNDTEENAADAALSELRAMKNVDKDIIRDVVSDTVYKVNNSDDVDPLSFEEADYFRVLDYVENNIDNDVNNKDINEAVENNEADIDRIYEEFNKNIELEKKLTTLQEQLSASYARETKLREELGKYKNQVRKLAESSKEVEALEKKLERANFQISEIENGISANEHKLNESLENSNKVKSKLTESIRQRDSRIKSLEEELESTKKQNVTQINENKTLRKEYDSLQESYADAQKDVAQLKEQYSKKLEQKNELIEKYQKIANRAVDKYIESQAIKLGVTSNEIKNKLPRGYGFKDIDSICESLQGYKLNMSTLPFSTSSLNEGVSLKARNVRRELLPRNEENEITDLELELASKMLK